jgi:hypothetical protein
MAVEDEYCHIYQNMQGRYEDGHRVVTSRVDVIDAEGMYVREFEEEIPVPHRKGVGTIWTPNSFDAFATPPPYHRYRSRIV